MVAARVLMAIEGEQRVVEDRVAVKLAVMVEMMVKEALLALVGPVEKRSHLQHLILVLQL